MTPILEMLLAESWAMEPNALRALFGQLLAGADLVAMGGDKAFFGGEDANAKPKDLNVVDGVAHIPIKGTIMKTVPSVFRWFGIAATSTVDVQDQLTRAVEDPRVTSIMLDIESPGGIVKGVAELAADIQAARELKPTNAHITDMGASAAYWLASQASSVSANAMATVGSIGVYSVVEDTSAQYEKRGVKVHVVSTHPLKGAGVEGSQITPDQLGDMQRMIDQYGKIFVDAVAAGRGVDAAKIQESATGQVWLAEEAKARGLVDHVRTADAAHSAARGTVKAEEISAPLGAQPEESMAEKETAERLAQLESEKAAVDAENKAIKAQMAAIDEERVDALMATHRDRIAPTATADMKEALLKMPKEKREPFLQALAPVTRKEAASTSPATGQDKPASALESGELFVAKEGGLSATRATLMEQVVGYRSDGSYDLADGRNVSRDEAKKLGIVAS